MITPDKARLIERLGLDKITVRSPLTCQAHLGICRLCYGMDLSDWGTRRRRDGRWDYRGSVHRRAGHSTHDADVPLGWRGIDRGKDIENEYKAKKAGILQFERITIVTNDQKEQIGLTRTGELLISPWCWSADHRDASTCRMVRSCLSRMDRKSCRVNRSVVGIRTPIPIFCEEPGVVKWEDIKEGVTMRKETRQSLRASNALQSTNTRANYTRRSRLAARTGKVLRAYFIPERANFPGARWTRSLRRDVACQTPREVSEADGHHGRIATGDRTVRGTTSPQPGCHG